MRSFGTEDSGFAVDYRSGGRTVVVRAWGFWDPALAAAFPGAVTEACQEATPPFGLLLEVSQLKPQREAGQGAFRALMTALREGGPARTAVVFENAITKMQLTRIARETATGGWRYFPSEEDATDALTGRR